MNIKKVKYIVIIVISLVAIFSIGYQAPIAQDIEYHLFIDQRTLLGLPNFWNVTSNISFLVVGVMGLYSLIYTGKMWIVAEIKTAYLLFFSGITLLAFGSGYYHLQPNNSTLLWDRLAMTIVFMSFFSIIIAEYISIRVAKFMLWPLIILGGYSVLYWYISELDGKGDLRLYILVQFLPMLLIPLILILFKSKFSHSKANLLLFTAYVIAKICELFDAEIYSIFQIISGHSLKHLIAALGIFLLLISYNIRHKPD